MIPRTQLDGFLHVLDASGAPQRLSTALRGTGKGGRSANLTDIRLYLLGGLIATSVEGQATVAAMVRALTTQLARSEKRELGVPTDPEELTKFQNRLYAISKTITTRLNFGDWLELDTTEAARRVSQLDELVDAVLAVTLLPQDNTTFAMDASGIHAWGRYAGRIRATNAEHNPDSPDTVDDRQQAPSAAAPTTGQGIPERAEVASTTGNADTIPIDRSDQDGQPAPPENKPRKGSYDPEARMGGKTNKDGDTEWFFGYHLHALTRTCTSREGIRQGPLALQTFTVTPANADVVEPSFRLLDRAAAAPVIIEHLAVDRHYSYKQWDRWREPLRRRGINPIHDLRKDEHGFQDYNGMKMAGGWPHCPATPEGMGTILRPAPKADTAEQDEFRGKIGERKQYALTRINDQDDNGRTRWGCPALDGRVACTLRSGTVQAAHQQAQLAAAEGRQPVLIPIITTAQDHQPPDALLPICEQQTVAVSNGPHMKLYQLHYWGSPQWEAQWNRRTFVEGWFGIAKNPTVAGMDRHFYRTIGVAHVTLAILFAAVVVNIRLLQTWHQETGLAPADHPLVQVDDEYGFERLDVYQAAHIDSTTLINQLATIAHQS